MGVGSRNSIAGFAARSQAFATVGLPIGATKGVATAALMATTAARASIAAGSGGDSALSNVGRGARVGAKYDVRGGVNPTALIRATGPLHLLDNPTSPHTIVPRSLKKGRSRASRGSFYNALFGGGSGFGSARPLRTPYGPRYRVQHPGTRGKRTFFNAIDNVRPLLPIAFRTEMVRQMRGYFG